MKISTRSRYGLRFMVYLGRMYPERVIQVNEVAEKEHISEKYLEQIVHLLKAAKLIESTRGPKGGYRLTRNPSVILLQEIMESLEQNMAPVQCINEGMSCHMQNRCVTQDVWRDIKQVIDEYLTSVTLADLVAKHRQKNPTHSA